MISKISLFNFRNHKKLCIDTASKYVMLSGPNGCGKTSILEAISILLPGYGIRSTTSMNILNIDLLCTNKDTKMDLYNDVKAWQIDMILNNNVCLSKNGKILLEVDKIDKSTIKKSAAEDYSIEDDFNLKVIYNLNSNKKNIYNNENYVRSASHMLDVISVIWFIPQMNNIFIEGAAGRRRLIDRMVYNFAKEHADDSMSYAKQLNSRLKLLKNEYKDIKWLNSIEATIAEVAFRIALRRVIVVHQMNCVSNVMYNDYDNNDKSATNNTNNIKNIKNIFNKPLIEINGDIEFLFLDFMKNIYEIDCIKNSENLKNTKNIMMGINENILSYISNNQLLNIFINEHEVLKNLYSTIIQKIKESYVKFREKDAIIGQSRYGVHKSDVVVKNSNNGIFAKFCSSGEQKSLLISLILLHIHLLVNANMKLPKNKRKIIVLLLDDVLTHLDKDKISALFNILDNVNVQVWITGTNLDTVLLPCRMEDFSN